MMTLDVLDWEPSNWLIVSLVILLKILSKHSHILESQGKDLVIHVVRVGEGHRSSVDAASKSLNESVHQNQYTVPYQPFSFLQNSE